MPGQSRKGPYKIAILWRGDAETRRAATPANNRYHRIFEELAALGLEPEPAIYDEAFEREVESQLLAADGVLVWVDPLHLGKNRTSLDAMLRRVAARGPGRGRWGGPWVSAHPDAILKMGTKEVLYRTRDLGWGSDAHFYRSSAEFTAGFPPRLRSSGPRVLKRNRGNGGQGVWKVEPLPADQVCVLEAARGSVAEMLSLSEFMDRCETYIAADGGILDQKFQPRLPEGMIRCYVGVDKVVGFGHQLIKALLPPPPEGPDSQQAQPGPRIMHGPDAPEFQVLRNKMEAEWVPQMIGVLGLERGSLPIIWDADFLYGPRTASGQDTYVLCEINISSVFAIPDEAPAAIARLVLQRCRDMES